MKVVVFLGPSLPRASAHRILPQAVFLPPARQADVLSAVETYHPEVVALIDGSFGQSLSVWHKEILFALERGVRVYGAASLGALRAVELAPFGMLGIGEVYECFASGELEDDDEVALLHAPAAEDFRALSEPLVNLRASFARAQREGVLTAAECELLIATAKQRYFADRTLSTIVAAAEQHGLSATAARRVSAYLAEHWVDVKRRDAERLLTLIRDLPDPLPAPDPPSFRLERSASFETLYANDRRVRHDGIDVPLRSIAAYAALHLGDFDELNFAALNRALVLVLADVLHVAPTAAEIEAESMRFRRRRGLETEALLATWLEAHGLVHESFVALMREVATCRRLQRWLLVRDRGMHRTRWLLDELRLRDEYTDVASAAAQQRRVLEAWNPEAGGEALPDDVDLETLAADHHRSTAWRVDTALSDWAEEAGFATGQDLALELLRTARVRDRLRAAARAVAPVMVNSGARPDADCGAAAQPGCA